MRIFVKPAKTSLIARAHRNVRFGVIVAMGRLAVVFGNAFLESVIRGGREE